jgi:uncharacterized protein
MVRKILRITGWVLLALVLVLAVGAFLNRETIQRLFLGGLKVYETTPPQLPTDITRPAILVFSKTNGFRHKEAIPAANALFRQLARDNGWGIYQTENGAIFRPELLSRFDAVVFNNVSGDVFTAKQRAAFKAFLENGGGFVGVHGSGGDMDYDWKWYVDELIGAQFIGHTLFPQFQQATVQVEDKAHPATQGLPASWQRTEEWYSFARSARASGANVLITVDEKTYSPEGLFGSSLRMGADHPMVWTRCIGKGRVLYSAFGHRAEAYAEPQNKALLTNSVSWAMKLQGTECDAPSTTPVGDKKP